MLVRGGRSSTRLLNVSLSTAIHESGAPRDDCSIATMTDTCSRDFTRMRTSWPGCTWKLGMSTLFWFTSTWRCRMSWRAALRLDPKPMRYTPLSNRVSSAARRLFPPMPRAHPPFSNPFPHSLSLPPSIHSLFSFPPTRRRDRRRERRALLRGLEASLATRPPRDGVAARIADGDGRIVESRVDVRHTLGLDHALGLLSYRHTVTWLPFSCRQSRGVAPSSCAHWYASAGHAPADRGDDACHDTTRCPSIA